MKTTNKKNPDTPHLHKAAGFWFCECSTVTGVGSTPVMAFSAWYQWRIARCGRG